MNLRPQKERPILLGEKWVRAAISGRKTQTRRPIMPQPPSDAEVRSLCGSGFHLFTDGSKDRVSRRRTGLGCP